MIRTIASNHCGRRNCVTAIIAISLLLAAALGCRPNKDPDVIAPGPEYYGTWNGEDGSSITIRSDGTGDYQSGGSIGKDTKVELDTITRTLSFVFVGTRWQRSIDKLPVRDRMTLSGTVYRRVLSDPKTDELEAIPADSFVQILVAGTIKDLAAGVDSGDYSTLYDNASTDFRSSFTKEKITAQFKMFANDKPRFVPVLRQVERVNVAFSPEVSIRNEKGLKILVAEGTFETYPEKVNFETEYVERSGEWKLLSLVVRVQ